MNSPITYSLQKRTFKNKPICAYNKKDWLMLFEHLFREEYKKDMFDKEIGYSTLKKMLFMTYGIKEAFVKRSWSALEFKFFLTQQIKKKSYAGIDFNIFSFKKPYCSVEFDLFEKEFRKRRVKNKFYSTIYHKYYQIRFDKKNDIFEVLKELNDDYIKMIFSFGIPITHKYIRSEYNKTNLESKKIIIKCLRDKILKRFSDNIKIIRKFLYCSFENSILWGPYINKEIKTKYIIPDEHVFDYQNDFIFLWKNFQFNKMELWERQNQNMYLEMMSPVRDIFIYGLKRKKKKKSKKSKNNFGDLKYGF